MSPNPPFGYHPAVPGELLSSVRTWMRVVPLLLGSAL